jgi:hypothetical protein
MGSHRLGHGERVVVIAALLVELGVLACREDVLVFGFSAADGRGAGALVAILAVEDALSGAATVVFAVEKDLERWKAETEEGGGEFGGTVGERLE